MADVRSMLRNERASRRINHPQAAYSIGGSLSCNICHLQLKSEKLWEGHLRSPGHVKNLQKFQAGLPSRPPVQSLPLVNDSKKRKANDDDDDDDLDRKRSKAAEPVPVELLLGSNDGIAPIAESDENSRLVEAESKAESLGRPLNVVPAASTTEPHKSPLVDQAPPTNDTVDEDEWAAFEREIAVAPAPDALNSNAVISAPAVSAAELAARSIEEANAQRKERREAEIEGEKEDAARQLEEEFDQMETYEMRVKRLKEKREELRKKNAQADAVVEGNVVPAGPSKTESDGEDDSDPEEWDDWGIKTI